MAGPTVAPRAAKLVPQMAENWAVESAGLWVLQSVERSAAVKAVR